MISPVENGKLRQEKILSIANLCEVLSISEATAKNWIKLNKIKPSFIKGSTAYFSQDYVNSLLTDIKSNSTNVLKSRRNKKHVSGSFLYKDYISSCSKNIDVISQVLNYIETKKIILTEQEIKYIVADCTIQLLIQKKSLNNTVSKNFLCAYLLEKFSFGQNNKLIDDLIDDKNNALKFIEKYPKFFHAKYFYETREDILGLLYISLSNLGRRKAKGAYYTPTNIVQKVINNLDFSEMKHKKIFDPSCGSGNFLLHLPQNINIENIYGNDIDTNAIKIARLNMVLNFEVSDIDILYKNFTNKDFLLEKFDEKFDYIIGNPPWGAEFPPITITKLKEKYLATDNKNIDSYDVFIEKSLSCLNIGGNLSFVIPESLLSVKNHKTIRNIIMKKSSIKYLEYLGNSFNNVQCPSIILHLEYTEKTMSCIGMKVVNKSRNFVIKKERKTNFDTFSFDMNDAEYSVYNKILNSQNKIYLKDNAIFALGIVTGNNKKYISNTKTDKNEIILKGSDIEKYKINKPNLYIEYNPQNFQQVAPTQYYRAEEKLFYKFISNKLVFAYDNEQILSLNSCNILIPKLVGYNIKYIMAILNSRITQFIFEKTYNSVKVLRSHVENIPIPICDKHKQIEIIKLVDKITNNNDNFSELYETLEKKISDLYDINEGEYCIIKEK